MRGLVLSAISLALLVLGTIVGLRFYRGAKEFKVFLGAFGGAVVLYAGGFWLLPSDLGFLSAGWRESSPAVDFGNGLLILALVFHGFWSFSYFVCVSPSMSALIALRLRRGAGLGSAEPVNLIFQRRLPKLLQGGYVSEEAGRYRLLARGGKVAALGSFLK